MPAWYMATNLPEIDAKCIRMSTPCVPRSPINIGITVPSARDTPNPCVTLTQARGPSCMCWGPAPSRRASRIVTLDLPCAVRLPTFLTIAWSESQVRHGHHYVQKCKPVHMKLD